MNRITHAVRIGGHAYSDDNGQTWRWDSNDSPCPLDACETYGIPCNKEAQKKAIDAHTEAFFKEYRARMENYQYSPEELWEMRAAFGEGATVVNVITGKETKL